MAPWPVLFQTHASQTHQKLLLPPGEAIGQQLREKLAQTSCQVVAMTSFARHCTTSPHETLHNSCGRPVAPTLEALVISDHQSDIGRFIAQRQVSAMSTSS